MNIPRYQDIMLPLLKIISDGKDHENKEVKEEIAKYFKLTKKEQFQLQPSGLHPIFPNRYDWGKFCLKRAGLIQTNGSSIRITKEGKKILKSKPEIIDRRFLMTIPKFNLFIKKIKKKNEKIR